MNLYLYLMIIVVYLCIGINYLRCGNVGLFIAFISYALANIGLYIEGK